MAQQQAIHKFVLGNKELEGKTAEFLYDKGWYSITDIIGEERNVIYRSRNAQEAYMKWNVYIGRKKERPVPQERRRSSDNAEKVADTERKTDSRQESKEQKERTQNRENHNRRRNKDHRRDNRREE